MNVFLPILPDGRQALKVIHMALQHVPLLHQIYAETPHYFKLLGTKLPNVNEVKRDVETALHDPRRKLALLYDEADELVGSIDYKINYPETGDLTINLLLIREDRQNQRLGQQAIQHLEEGLPVGTNRVLASVLGKNPRGARFWERLGYEFALDARPVMTWYAKYTGDATKKTALPTTPSSLPPIRPAGSTAISGD